MLGLRWVWCRLLVMSLSPHLFPLLLYIFYLIGVETPDVIDLCMPRRKELDRPLYQVGLLMQLLFLSFDLFVNGYIYLVIFSMKVLEEKEERIAPGTFLGATHTYAIVTPLNLYFSPYRCDYVYLLTCAACFFSQLHGWHWYPGQVSC